MKRIRVDITGMSCESCVTAVCDGLARITGVKAYDVEVNGADITFDDMVCRQAQIVGAIRAAGFDVTGFSQVAE